MAQGDTNERFAVAIDQTTATRRLIDALGALENDEAAAFRARKLFGSSTTLGEGLTGGGAELPKTIRFSAIALDDKGEQSPVQSSDAIFDLYYGTPAREELLAHAQTLFQPYPLGLITPVGVATSNATFSYRPRDKELFGKGTYHGSKVVWGWQQPMLKQGIERQRKRFASDAAISPVPNSFSPAPFQVVLTEPRNRLGTEDGLNPGIDLGRGTGQVGGGRRRRGRRGGCERGRG